MFSGDVKAKWQQKMKKWLQNGNYEKMNALSNEGKNNLRENYKLNMTHCSKTHKKPNLDVSTS